jgi:hypothetical protein
LTAGDFIGSEMVALETALLVVEVGKEVRAVTGCSLFPVKEACLSFLFRNVDDFLLPRVDLFGIG